MKADTKIRKQIIQRIQNIPDEKLDELDYYISKLEKNLNKKEKILSFAGAWENLSENIFDGFTDRLIETRERNIRRFNEQDAD